MKSFESPPNPFLPDEDLIRRTSRTVLHAAERQRQPLFEKLTAKNAERIVELMKQKPIFHENDPDAPRQILLDPVIADLMPPEFFNNPTKWIESQKNIQRGYETNETLPGGESIDELWKQPYDISKVKELKLPRHDGSTIEVVSKRIDPTQLEEIFLAREAYEAGIPTPKVLAEIVDHGNTYAFFERISGVNYDAFKEIRSEQFKVIAGAVRKLEFSIFEKPQGQDPLEICNSLVEKFRMFSLRPYRDREFEELFNKRRTDKFEELIYKRRWYLFRERLISSVPASISENPSVSPKDIVRRAFGQLTRAEIRDLAKLGFTKTELYESGKWEREKKREIMDIFFEYNKEKIIKNRTACYKFLREDDEMTMHMIEARIKQIKGMCDERGIVHKDFNDRNFVIPLIDGHFTINEDDKIKIYLVDWEPKPKSPSK